MSWAVVRPAHVEMHHSRCHKKPGPTCGALNARSLVLVQALLLLRSPLGP